MEIITSCPTTYGEINLATGWFATLNSPDYFNSCNDGPYKTQDANLGGTQMPFHGGAYCAMVCKNSNSDYHEHQTIKLIQPLIVNNTYQCRMWVSLCEISSYGSNKLGFQFSANGESSVNNLSQLYTDSIITNKTNWVLISGSFVAKSPFAYVSIGNFFEDSHTKMVRLDGGSYGGAYFYVDSISVSGTGEVVIEKLDLVLKRTVEPGVFSMTGLQQNSSLLITKASGEVVFSTDSASQDMKIDLSPFDRGTYCVIVESLSGDIVRKIITY